MCTVHLPARRLQQLTSGTHARFVLQEDVEIQDDGETEGGGDVFAAYYAEGSGDKQADRPVVFMPEIGLAMESLKGDFTIESLWSAM